MHNWDSKEMCKKIKTSLGNRIFKESVVLQGTEIPGCSPFAHFFFSQHVFLEATNKIYVESVLNSNLLDMSNNAIESYFPELKKPGLATKSF